MKHGRKSRTKRIDGYKRHIAIANGLILATAVEPANVREYEPAARLLEAAKRHGTLEVLDIDRGYLASPAVAELHRSGVVINSRAWKTTNHDLFTKDDFRIQLRRKRVICPAGASAPITPTSQVFFDRKECGSCELKERCTKSPRRSLTIHPLEDLLIELRANARSRNGRAELRRRTVVEHRLARVGAIQGTRARYRGRRKNELDLNRAAALANLLEVARRRCA
jgi:IS5 family transposase